MRNTMQMKRDLERFARWAQATKGRKAKPSGRRKSAPLWLKLRMICDDN